MEHKFKMLCSRALQIDISMVTAVLLQITKYIKAVTQAAAM
jgi:hypothetical protein